MGRLDEYPEEERRVFLGLTDDRSYFEAGGLAGRIIAGQAGGRPEAADDEFLRSVGIKP